MRRLALVALLLGGCRINLESTVDDMKVPDGGMGCVKGTSGVCQCVMGTSSTCVAAVGKNTFSWINDNILNNNCLGSSCHQAGSSSNAKKNPYGDAATSYPSLVNFASNVKPGTVLVVPGQPKQSYALVMLNKLPAEDFLPSATTYPASDIGLMPQSNLTLCCQKLDAIEAWITAGALNN